MNTLADYNDEMMAYWLGHGGNPRYDVSYLLPAIKDTNQITIYRTVPANIRGAVIRPGDYVAVSENYARQHAYNNLGGWQKRRSHMLQKIVGLDELEPANPCEFWYRPRSANVAPGA